MYLPIAEFYDRCREIFSYLAEDYGFNPEPEISEYLPHETNVFFANGIVGVNIQYEPGVRRKPVKASLVKLYSGDYYPPGGGFPRTLSVDYLIGVRAPEIASALPQVVGRGLFDEEALEQVRYYADAIKKVAADILRNDFTAFDELRKRAQDEGRQ